MSGMGFEGSVFPPYEKGFYEYYILGRESSLFLFFFFFFFSLSFSFPFPFPFPGNFL